MLELDEKDNFKGHSHEWAWSHFMTVVMFGMLEVAVKSTPCAKYDKRGHLRKCISIKYFLESYLPKELRDDIAKRYKTEDGHTLSTFPEVVEHLWSEIRSGFIHEGSLNFKGMEWNSFKGIGSKNDPMTIVIDVPMQELLQITWMAILNSYGYTGRLELPKYKV